MLDIDRGHKYPAAHHHEPNFRGPNHALFPADHINFAEIGSRIKIYDGDSLIVLTPQTRFYGAQGQFREGKRVVGKSSDTPPAKIPQIAF